MFASTTKKANMRLLPLFLFFFSVIGFSQVKGTITDSKKNPLSFVSIYLDGTVTGTTSNEAGSYVLPLKKTGSYTIVYQFLGYKTAKKKVDISSFPYELDMVLEEESISLSGIFISTKENPANEIIRQVIENKEENTDKFKTYTAKFYSRGLYKIKDAPEKFLGQALGDFGGGLDSTRSGIIYLSETIYGILEMELLQTFKTLHIFIRPLAVIQSPCKSQTSAVFPFRYKKLFA